MKTFVNIFGWYGTVAIITAYALVSFAIIEPSNIWYQVLNATGALGIVTISFYDRAYQPGVLNVVWAIIAIVAILKMIG